MNNAGTNTTIPTAVTTKAVPRTITLKFAYKTLKSTSFSPSTSSNFRIVFDTLNNQNIVLEKFDEETKGEKELEYVYFKQEREGVQSNEQFESDRLFLEYKSSTEEITEQIAVFNGQFTNVVIEHNFICLECSIDFINEKNLDMKVFRYDNESIKTELSLITPSDTPATKELIINWL